MTCIPILEQFGGRKGRVVGFVCVSPFYRLRLEDGTCVFMEFHRYCGPTFYRDRATTRDIPEWYDNPLICKALDWFVARGHRA